MSTVEPAPPPATPAARPRWRRVLFALALLLGGGVIGAIVASPGHGFGPRWSHGGPYGWDRGYQDPTMHPAFGGGGFFPGRIERAVDRVLGGVDASSEQRQKITTIVQRTADDLFALREKHLEGRKQLRDTLAAPQIDRGKIEALRAEQMQLAETASKRISDAIAETAEILTPAQRADLARRLERWQRWRRG